jgi:hypothetical protein
MTQQKRLSDDCLLHQLPLRGQILVRLVPQLISYKFIQNFKFSSSERGIVAVVGGQQTAVQGKPLLAETLLHQLPQSLENKREIALQLGDTRRRTAAVR